MKNVNVFIVETELQALGVIQILKEMNSTSYIFAKNSKLADYLSMRCVAPVSIMNRNHKGGWIGKALYIWRSIQSIDSVLNDKENISFYMPRLDNAYNNAIYSYFSKTRVVYFHIIPDGFLNYVCSKIQKKRYSEIKKWRSRLYFLTLGRIPITLFSGNELGGDIAKSVYYFGGIKPEWVSESQARGISFPIESSVVDDDGDILIVGQNMKYSNLVNDSVFNSIQTAIENLVAKLPSHNIHYVKHPRAAESEFFVNGAESPQGNYLCVEELISTGKYRHVISCCSSALINAKLMAGDSISSWAVGIEYYPFPTNNKKQQLLDVCKNLGINVVDL